MSLIAPGTPIAVVAPCGAYNAERFALGLKILRDHGHDPRPLPGLLRPWRYLAGDDNHRAEQLQTALTHPDFGAVWIARGGSGLGRILHRLDYESLPKRPVVGFSDVTSLHTALHLAGAGPAIHGPVVHSLGTTDDASLTHLFDLLAGRPVAPLQGVSWVSGDADGPLVGGNVCVLAAMCGTPWQLDARGAVLVLEDNGEPAYKLDRLVQQLSSAGVLDGLAGVAVGQLTHCRVPDGADYGISDVIRDHLEPLGVPVVGDLPIGHATQNRAFPWGARGSLRNGTLSWRPVSQAAG